MTMMAILHLPEDKTTLNNIAKKLGTTKQNVNTLIGSIGQKGYVDTFPSARDKRAVNVRITDSGKQVMLDCNEKGLDFFADIFAGFTAEELETLWGLLKKLYRFNGEEQDGFEEDASGKVENTDEYQKRLLERFLRTEKPHLKANNKYISWRLCHMKMQIQPQTALCDERLSIVFTELQPFERP
jgi:DNA-binding MarR family transcriptional regulator